MQYRKFRKLGTTVVAAASLILAGCGEPATSSAPPADDAGLNLKAEVDSAHSNVILPADRFGLRQDEKQTLLGASTAATAACAREKLGIAWVGFRPATSDDPAYHMWADFGPWTKDLAQKFAFVPPMSDRDLVGNGIVAQPADFKPAKIPNTQLTEEQTEKVGKVCSKDSQVKKFAEESLAKAGPWEDELSKTKKQLARDPRAKKVFGELRACYKKQGMTFDEENPGFVVGANTEKIDEQQIGLALKVADCQQQTNATPRLAEIMADIQAPTIKKYAKELTAQRKRIDNALSEAKNYTSQHPELFEAPK